MSTSEEECGDENKTVLSEDAMILLQEAFDVFDPQAEGTIDTRKLFKIMRALGQNPTEAEVQDLINAVDDDGNGTIEFDEFVGMMNRKWKDTDTKDEIEAAFRVYDQDGKGYITGEDLEKVMSDLGMQLPPGEITEMINETDRSGDGHVTQRDFINLMSAQPYSTDMREDRHATRSTPGSRMSARTVSATGSSIARTVSATGSSNPRIVSATGSSKK